MCKADQVIIDFHTHIFPEKIASSAIEKLRAKSHTKPFTDGTARMLQTSMEKAKIKLSIAQPVATSPTHVPKINNLAISINEQWKSTGIMSFGSMYPGFEGWQSELERISEAGLKGIKLHPVYQDSDIDDPRYLCVIKKATELGLIILIHAGWDVGFPGAAQALPDKIFRALSAASTPSKIVLAHMGGWRCWDEAKALLCNTGVYIDTAFSLGSITPDSAGGSESPSESGSEELEMLSELQFIDIVKSFGIDHVLFGTDSPWSDQSESVRAINALPLSEEEKSLIFHKNAARLLGLIA